MMKHWFFKLFRFTLSADSDNKKCLINLDTGAFVCTMLAYLVNYNALHAGFVYDDGRAIIRNPDILTGTPMSNVWKNDFWGTAINSSNSHGSYRPLCVISFRLNYWLSEFKPFSYHMANVILHCVSTYLVLTLGRLLIPYPAHMTAAILFAVHPIHCEAVASVVGRADVLANIFFCSAFWCYIKHVRHRNRWPIAERNFNEDDYDRRRRVGLLRYKCCAAEYHTKTYRLGSMLRNLFELFGNSCTTGQFDGIPRKVSECSEVREWACLLATLVLAAGAMLCKETGITVLGVCVAYDFIKTKPRLYGQKYRLFRSVVILGCTGLVLLSIRFYIMGDYNRPVFATSDNPTSKSKCLLTRTLTFLYLPVFNFLLLVYPTELSFDWGMDAIPRIDRILDRRNLASLIFYALAYRLLKRSLGDCVERRYKYDRQIDNDSDPYYDYDDNDNDNESDKCYYLIYEQRRHNINGYCRKTKKTSTPFYRQYSTTTTTTTTRSPSCLYRRGNRHYEEDRLSKRYHRNKRRYACPNIRYYPLADLYLLSISLMVLPFLPATNLLFYVGFVVAERVLYIPSVGYCFLAAIALDAFERRTNIKTFRCLVVVLIFVFAVRTVYRNKDWHDEESLYRSGISVNPPKAYVNLGSILSSEGRIEEAEEVLNLALKYRPNMAEAHYNLAIIKQGTGRIREAITSYEMAIHYRPSMALAHLNLGQLLAKEGLREKAEQVLRRCYGLDGTGLKDPRTHHSTRITALVHLGRIQAERGNYWESIATYKEAIRSIPENYEHFQMLYRLLGESLIQIGRHEEADKCYKLAAIEPPRQIELKLKYGKHLPKNKSRIARSEKWIRKNVETPNSPIHRQDFIGCESSQRQSSRHDVPSRMES